MGELFQRYFQLLAARLPEAEYGVVASPVEVADEADTTEWGCLCSGDRGRT